MAAAPPPARAVIVKSISPIATDIVGIRIPDTAVAGAAAGLAQSAMPPVLFNHCLRTFVLGMIAAKKSSSAIDEEGCFVSSILHDLALLPNYAGDLTKSFEQNGAEFARRFATERGFSNDRADKIAQAILLHAGGAGGREPDIAFVMNGAAQDLFGPKPEQLADDQLAAVEKAVPRLGFRIAFVSLLGDHVKRTKNPTWTADFAQAPPGDFTANRWSE